MRFILLSTVVLFLAAAPVDVTGERFGTRATATWDPVTQDISGQPEVLQSYEVAFTYPPNDVRTGAVPIKTVIIPADVTTISLADQIAAINPGEGKPLRIWVRAIDKAGNISDWSNMLEGSIDTIPPRPVGGCKILR